MSQASSSSGALPADIAQPVEEFDDQLKKIEVLVHQLQAAPWAKTCGSGTAALDSARLHLTIAYAVNSLFWIYLRTQGVRAQNHPVRGELERIKNSLRKLKEAEVAADKGQHADSNGGLPDKSQPHTQGSSTNAAAAHRFIKAALGKDSRSGSSPGQDEDPAGDKREGQRSRKEKRKKSGNEDGGKQSGKKVRK